MTRGRHVGNPHGTKQVSPDTCGLGTRWGCGRMVRDGDEGVQLLVRGRAALNVGDDGNVLFHAACSPAVVEPDAVRRWSGTWTARHEATNTNSTNERN